jgi:PAS domain S-box-containing protein
MLDITVGALREENAYLHSRLKDSDEILRALRAGEVDAIIAETAAGMGVFTLKGADHPYREMVETMSEGAVTVGAEGLIVYCNHRFADMLKTDLKAVMGTPLVAHFVEPDHVSRITTQLLCGGEMIPVSVAISADAASHFVIIVSDMTEVNAAHEEITKQSALLNNILQSSTKHSIVGATLDGNILFWNEGARRMYGYTETEIIGQPMDILYAPESRNSTAVQHWFKTAYDEGLAEGEFEHIRKDGTRLPAQIVVTRRGDALGNPIGYLLISSDISDQRQAAEQLRAISQYARSLLEACLDPLITISPDGVITDVNHATELITGQIRERLIGSDFAICFTESEKARTGYQRVFTKGFLIDYRLAIRHMAGTVSEVLCNASLYHDAGGRVAGVFLVARDISRMLPADLIPPPKRRHLKWDYVGIIAAALVFIVAALMLPTISNVWLRQHENQHNLSQLSATNSRMQTLLREVTPTPARVQAARVNQSITNLGLGYTITYAVAAPNHDPGIVGREHLLSQFANGIDALSAGNCVRPPPKTETPEGDSIICPIIGHVGLLGLLFLSWDKGDAMPVNFDAPLAVLKRAGSDIASIWLD